MRTALLLSVLALPLLGQDQKPEPEPIDLAKVLRESKEFAEKCKQLRISWKEGEVRAVGEIAYRGGGPCEYLINVSPAKAHETVVLLDDGPWMEKRRRPRDRLNGYATALNNAFLCAGYEKGKPFDWDRETGDVFPPKGETVHIYVEWKDKDGKPVRARMADMLWNFKTIDVMQRGKFVYTGSLMIDEGPPDHKKWFGAEVDRLLVAIMNTNTALIDNIEEGGLDNGAYEGIHARIPEVGTRVTVVFSRNELDGVTEFPPLELPKEVHEARAERAKKLAQEKTEAAKKEKEKK